MASDKPKPKAEPATAEAVRDIVARINEIYRGPFGRLIRWREERYAAHSLRFKPKVLADLRYASDEVEFGMAKAIVESRRTNGPRTIWIYKFHCRTCGKASHAATYRKPESYDDADRLSRIRVCAKCVPKNARASLLRHRARTAVKPTARSCAECGAEFTAKRSDASTCSAKCRQRRRRRAANAEGGGQSGE